jgi:hypothetical protein
LLSNVIRDLTGKNPEEFVVTYNVTLFSPDSRISAIPFSENAPIVLTRQFPLRFVIDGSDDWFEQQFHESCTIRSLSEFIRESR